MKYKLLFSLSITLIAIFSFTDKVQAACPTTINTDNIDITLNSVCVIPADTTYIIDKVTNETSTVNGAELRVSSGSLTISGGATLKTGTLVPNGGSIIIQTGGSIVIGGTTGTGLWVADADADGYAASFETYTATAAGRRRIGLMRSFSTLDCSDARYSTSNLCVYRRNIAVTNSVTTKTNFDVLVTLDTATLITAGKMTTDCGDIRFTDSDNTTSLSYWIEGGCNTASTDVWVRVPSIPNGSKNVYLDYDGTTTTNGTQSWSGNITTIRDTSCDAAWTRNTSFDARFPLGSSTYGTTAGSSTNTHANLAITTGSPNSFCGVNVSANPDNNTSVRGANHTHTATLAFGTTTALPPYKDAFFCSSNSFMIPSDSISLFTSTVPSGWTRFSALDGYFVRGNSSYGATGGSTTHTHTITNTTTSSGNPFASCAFASASLSVLSADHSHSITSQSTSAGSNMPPYLPIIYGKNTSITLLPVDSIVMSNQLPPMGWTRYTGLDGLSPYGAAALGVAAGASTHTHPISISTTTSSFGSSLCRSGSTNISCATHGHSISSTTASSSHASPTLSTLFISKNNNVTAGVSISTGAEY